MRNIIAITVSALAMSVSIAQAQNNYGLSVFYDMHDHRAFPCASTKIGSFTNILGRKSWELQFSAIAGQNTNSGNSFGGFAVGATGKLADQVSWSLGAGAKVEQNLPIRFGVLVGIQVSFDGNTVSRMFRAPERK